MMALRSSAEIPARISLICAFSGLPCFTPTAICASSGETVKPYPSSKVMYVRSAFAEVAETAPGRSAT